MTGQLRYETCNVKRNTTMKKMMTMVALAVWMLTGCISQQQRLERQAATAQAVRQAVETRQLTVEVRFMQTQRYGSHRVGSDFFLRLRGDTLDSYLPFLGRAYTAPLGSPSQGLNFTSAIEHFRRSPLNDGGVRLEMSVRSEEDRFDYRLDVFPNGKAYIHVRPQERDAVSFDGEAVLF